MRGAKRILMKSAIPTKFVPVNIKPRRPVTSYVYIDITEASTSAPSSSESRSTPPLQQQTPPSTTCQLELTPRKKKFMSKSLRQFNMDESEIKPEVITNGGETNLNLDINTEDISEYKPSAKDDAGIESDTTHNTKNSNNSETTSNSPVPIKKKKRKPEIELGIKWELECKRERRSVVKYEHRELSKEEKDKVKSSRRRKKIIKPENNQDLICETCHRPFMTIQALIGHRKKHLRVKFTCSLCSEKFDTNAELIKHKIVHKDDDRTFTCLSCRMTFTEHLEYLKHKLKHQHCQTYRCEECGNTYNKKHGFLIHIQTHYDTMTKCEICHRFYNTYVLQTHMRMHTIKTKCVECGKILNGDSNYKYHMLSHTGVKPYQCLYCGKGFRTASARKVHTMSHTNERPFECTVCHQKFKQATDMNRHLVTHQNEKTIQCDICKKMFFHKESLKYHMTVHMKTQKYECKICGQRIHTLSSLRNHMLRKHTEGKAFACDVCNVAFKTASCLKKHQKQKYHINNEYKNKLREKEIRDTDEAVKV